MLHRFFDPTIGYTWEDRAPDAKFLERTFAYLRENNYNILPLDELITRVRDSQVFHKTVCFTVDDGYVDFKNTAFPVCKQYGVPVTVFTTTDFISGNMMMWWDQLTFLVRSISGEKLDIDLPEVTMSLPIQTKEEKRYALYMLLVALKPLPHPKLLTTIEAISRHLEIPLPQKVPIEYSALTWEDARRMQRHNITFEPHTLTHPILSRLSYEEQRQQIAGSVSAVQENLDTTPKVYCYPNGRTGDFTEETIGLAESEGLIAACTAERGYFGPKSGEGLFRIPRIPFPPSFEQVVLQVSGYRAFRQMFGWNTRKQRA